MNGLLFKPVLKLEQEFKCFHPSGLLFKNEQHLTTLYPDPLNFEYFISQDPDAVNSLGDILTTSDILKIITLSMFDDALTGEISAYDHSYTYMTGYGSSVNENLKTKVQFSGGNLGDGGNIGQNVLVYLD